MRNFVKQFAIPLQALTALGICLGLAWMVFVVAGFNPVPPTALELQARSTEDQSYASLNSTAAALAFGMVAEMVPSPIVMPVTGNSTPVPSSSPTIAVTLRVVSTGPESNTPSSIFSFFFQPTQSRDRRDDDPTATVIPTRTLRPTSTSLPPTSTRTRTPTPPPPTPTPLLPTFTHMPESPTPVTPATQIPTTATAPPPTLVITLTEETTSPPPPTEAEQTQTAPPIQITLDSTSEPATVTP